jgi:hypothetical protein
MGIALALAIHANVRADLIPGLYNTGVDAYGINTQLGTQDEHYALAGPVPEVFSILPHTLWIAAPQGSQWIGRAPGNVAVPAGYYVYNLQFDMTGLDLSTAVIDGKWASDNTSTLFLNGEVKGAITENAFSALTSFTLTSGFLPGINTLTFRVNNLTASASGLLIADLTGTADALLPGDLDLDGFVGIADLNLVLGHWNLPVIAGNKLQGDPTGNGFVGIEDLNLVLGNWNSGAPPAASGSADAVPEPASAAVLLTATIATASRRRALR